MPEPRVTADDVLGLRADTSRLADSIDNLAERQAVTESAVEGKADTDTVNEVKRLAGRANVNSLLAALAVLVAFLATFLGWRNNLDRADENRQAIATAQKAIDAAESSKADARLAACRGYNTDTADRVNAILTGLAATSKDPAAAEPLVAQYLLPRRNCTPSGVSDYYATPQGPNAYEPTTTPGG